MVSTTEHALMAGASYISTRDPVNQFPMQLHEVQQQSGF